MKKKINEVTILNPQGNIYIISDSHIDNNKKSCDSFNNMLKSLESPNTIIILGDLFKIWLALPKFWSRYNFYVLNILKEIQNNNTNIIFAAGNRELLLPREYCASLKQDFPFNFIFHDEFYLNWGKKRYGFIHGDTINFNDKNYLRWKSFSHSFLIESIFRFTPEIIARWIAKKGENLMSTTNKKFKISFPEKEIKLFAKNVLNNVDCFFIGHFHIDKEITIDQCSGILRIVPDWLTKKTILRIDSKGIIKTIKF